MGNVQKLYKALVSKGYSTDDIGDEKTFTDKMKERSNRKQLFDYVSSRNDFRIGDFENYEKRLISDYTEGADVPTETYNSYDETGNGYDPSSSTYSGGKGTQEEADRIFAEKQKEFRISQNKGDSSYENSYWGNVEPVDWRSKKQKLRDEIMYGGKAIPVSRDGEPIYPIKPREVSYSEAISSVNLPTPLDNQLEDRLKANEEALKKAYQRESEERNAFAQEHPFISAMGAGRSPRPMDADDEIQNLLAEREYLTNAKKVMNAARNDSGFFAGVEDAVSTPSFYDFGFTDLRNSGRVLGIKKKLDEGADLTPSEQSLLTSLGLQQELERQYSGLTGRMYRAGKTTAEMAPFMAEMALNPASGLGKAAAKAATKKFGKNGVKALSAKVAARTAGDVAGATSMALTSGMPSTVADAIDRYAGEAVSRYDSNGNLITGGLKNGESISSSIGKALGSRAIENWSEMVGQYFAPIGSAVGKLGKKVLGKFGLDKVNQFIDSVNSSDMAKLLDDFGERTAWSGNFGEFAEEQIGTITNSLIVGDSQLSDLTDWDKQLDTALGVGVFGSVMSLLRTAGYRTPRYRARKSVERSDKIGSEAFGEAWEDIKNNIDNSESDEQLKQSINEVVLSPDYTEAQKKAVIEYSINLKAQQAVNTIKEKKKLDEGFSVENQVEDSYDNGTEIVDPAEKHSAKRTLETLESSLGFDSDNEQQRIFAQKVIDGQGNISATLEELNKEGYSPEQIQLATEYYNALSLYNGMAEATIDRINEKVAVAEEKVDANINEDDGTIIPVMLKDGSEGYVVKGKIAVDSEGDIDINNSDNVIFIRDINGNVKMKNPRDLLSRGTIQSPETLKEILQGDVRSKLIKESQDEIDYNPDTPDPTQGESYINPDGEEMTVVGVDGQGGMFIVPTKDYQSANGNQKKMNELISGAMQLGVVPVDEFKQWASSQIDAEKEGWQEQTNSVLSEKEVVEENPPSNIANNISEEMDQAGNESTPSVEEDISSSVINEPYASVSEEQMPSSAIPLDEKGNPIYHMAKIEDTIADLMDGTLEDIEVDEFISANRKEAVDNIAKLESKPPKIGTNKAKYVQKKKEWQSLKDEQQKRVDYWNEVERQIKSIREKPGDSIAEEIISMENPLNGEEFAAQQLANGNIRLLQSSFSDETGFGKDEIKKYFGLFASAEKGGMTIQEAGEYLMQADRENGTNFFDQNDPNAGRDAIINILSQAGTRGELANFIKSNRETMAERERAEEYSAYEQWCENYFHMTPEKYETYESVIYDDIEKRALADEQYNDFMSTFVDEQINKKEDGQQRIDNKSKGSGEVLYGAQSISPGRVAGTTEGREEVDGGIYSEDGAVSKSSSGRNVIDIFSEAERISKERDIEKARASVNINPTEAQKEAGNYKKGHIKLDGYEISIENPKGSERSGIDNNGQEWHITMNNDYGYIRGTKAVDGDHIDIFLSDNPIVGNVFVVDQLNEKGEFDESKVMYGFSSADEARSAYLSNYSPGWENRVGAITEVTKDDFKKWIDSSVRKTKPFSEYKSVNPVQLAPSIESANAERMKDIEARLAEIEDRKIELDDILAEVGDDSIERDAVFSEQQELEKEQHELEAEYSGLREMNDESNNILASEGSDIRFREVDIEGKKTLIGIHNISEDKFRKAMRMGGFANPSAAVIDLSKQSHEGYGEISLLLPSSMIEKRTGINAGTFENDAWTPVYPQVERQFSGNGDKRAAEDIQSVPEGMRNTTRMGISSWMDGRSGRDLSYLFLHERGEAPKLVMIERKYDEDVRKPVIEATNGGFSLSGTNETEKKKILDVYIDSVFGGDKKAYQLDLEAKKERHRGLLNHQRNLVRKRAQDFLNSIEEIGFDYDAVSKFVHDIENDVRNGGKVNDSGTLLKAQEYIENKGLQKEFDKWLDALNDRYEIKEVIFNGFTPSGNRRYLPHTLENVSSFMKKSGLSGAIGMSSGFSNFAAGLLKAKGTLKDIRKGKGKLTTNHDEVDAFRDKWSDVFYELGMKLQPGAKDFEDYGMFRLSEAAKSKNPQKYLKDEYNIDFSDEDMKKLNEMIHAIREEYPAMYFETKFERPVYLKEFASAVVPDNASGDLVNVLKNAGLTIVSYKYGDSADRKRALDEAAGNDVRFRDNGYLNETNNRFNEELQQQIDGTLPKGHVYELGIPSDILIASGIPNLPIELASARLTHKSNQDNHPFDLSEVENLPEAIHNPLAVFRSATHIGSNVILTELTQGNKNFVVAIETNRKQGKIYVNSIRSIHPRTMTNVVSWINDGLMDYADHGRMSEWIAEKIKSRSYLNSSTPADVRKQLDSATKVVENFENPTLEQGKINAVVDELSESLHTPIEKITSADQIPQGEARRRIESGANIKGWYSPKENKVFLYMPNTTSVEDAQATIFHEVVAHKGLRDMFGKDFDEFLNNVYNNVSDSIRSEINTMAINRYGGNFRVATEEYLASLAERGPVTKEERTLWQKIKDLFVDLLRKANIDLGFELTDNELRYILWRSTQNLQNTNPLDVARNMAMEHKLGVDVNNRYKNLDTEKQENTEEDKKQEEIDKLRKEISNLKRNVTNLRKSKSNFEVQQRAVIAFINQRLTKEVGDELGSTRIKQLLSMVNHATTAKDLRPPLQYLEQLINSATYESVAKRMGKLIKIKLVSQTARGVSKGVKVDETTRQIFDSVRATFKDLLSTSVDSELRSVRGDIARIGKELKSLPEDNSDIRTALENRQNELKKRRNELENEKEELLTKNAIDTIEGLVERERELTNAKDEYKNEKKGIWTQEMDNELNAIPYRKKLAEIRKQINDMDNILTDAVNARQNAYKVSGNKRKALLSEAETNENLYTVAQQDLIKMTNEVYLDLKELIDTGKSNLANLRKEKEAHRKEIVNMAIEAVKKNRPESVNKKARGNTIAENIKECLQGVEDFVFATLGSFNFMLKAIDRNHSLGDGPLYKYFMQSDNGAKAAIDNRDSGIRDFKNEVDNKIKEIFGKNMDLIKISKLAKNKKVDVTKIYTYDSNSHKAGEEYTDKRSIAQCLYIWLSWRQADGRIKLEAEGWTEDNIEKLEEKLGDDYMKLGEWLTDDFLPRLRDNKYNMTHIKLFGTSMASREHYFPLSIFKSAITEKGELGENVQTLPTTVTGNIINRTVNKRPVDESLSAFDVLMKYAVDMEQWNATAILREDLNYLHGSMAFRNYMEANHKGSFKQFMKAAEIAVGAFEERIAEENLNKGFLKVQRLWTGSNIGFRLNTAMKQVLSYPAFLSYSMNPSFLKDWSKYLFTPLGNYRWAYNNLPSFRQRVDSGNFGNIQLKKVDGANSMEGFLDKFNKVGMWPNKTVDALTVAAGARCVYNLELKRAKERGMSDEEADNMARYQAEIVFNESQQSSSEEFISPMQASHSLFPRSLMAYQNSNVGYQRIGVEGLLDISRAKRVYQIDIENGMSEEEAKKKMRSTYYRGVRKASFGLFILGGLWGLGSQGIVGLTGELLSNLIGNGDDDKWLSDEDLKEITTSAIVSSVAGTSVGQFVGSYVAGREYNPIGFLSDIGDLATIIKNEEFGLPLMMKISSTGIKLGTGINLETFENIYLGAEGVIRKGRPDLVDFMFLINLPASQRKEISLKLYNDLGPFEYLKKQKEAQKMFDDYRKNMPYAKNVTSQKENEIKREYVLDKMDKETQESFEKEKEFKKLKRKYDLSTDREEWLKKHPDFKDMERIYGKGNATKKINREIKRVFRD